MIEPLLKPLLWVGSSKKDLLKMPDNVIDVMGYALHLAQRGLKHPQAKPLQGIGSAGVLEVVEDDDDNTYRGVYTVQIKNVVFVLHCFNKKSHKGIATPRLDTDLILKRLRFAQQYSEGGQNEHSKRH